MSTPEQIQEQYNIFVRVIEGKEINRLPLEELLSTGFTKENSDLLKGMYNVVLEQDGKVILLIPTAEVKSPEERNLALLQRQKERIEQQITQTQEQVKKQREQERELELRRAQEKEAVALRQQKEDEKKVQARLQQKHITQPRVFKKTQ